MAEGDEEIRPEDQEVEGGAVKSFLEHLEDLRWVLIKSSAALVSCMMLCLFGTRQLTAFLNWPLERAAHRNVAMVPADTNQLLTIQIGSLILQTVQVYTNRLGPIELGSNQYNTLQLDPLVAGTNTVLTMRVITNTAPPAGIGPKIVFLGGPGDPFMFSLHVA
ncbi:MAG TPA: twin-arginine translocase subunit TatC, partial [Candidatus Cybelea sp.]|nr:twin-arginine translocase subunit TatC [Candidatus Cybelea sp.]